MKNNKLTDEVASMINAVEYWQQGCDPKEGSEQYEFFGRIATALRELQERRKADNQEPAGYHVIRECGKVGCSVTTLEEAEKTRDFWNKKWTIRPYFYAAQPVPVVPDKISLAATADMPVVCFVSTPNGLEDTSRLDWLDAQNKRLNEYYGTSYGWKFDANFQRNAMMLNDSNYPVMDVRQAIDEAIAAAPRQEQRTADRETSKDE